MTKYVKVSITTQYNIMRGVKPYRDTLAKTTNLTQDRNTNLTLRSRLPVTTSATDNYTPVRTENLTLVPITIDENENLTV